MKIAVGPDKSGVSPRDRGGSTETHAAWDGRGGGRGGEKGPVFLERGLFPPHLRAYIHTRIHTRIHTHAYTHTHTHPLHTR